jgi:hypothetical protein
LPVGDGAADLDAGAVGNPGHLGGGECAAVGEVAAEVMDEVGAG